MCCSDKPPTWRLLALSALLWSGLAGQVQAMTADEAFADGNRLFRDDLYWAALLRYGQAADAGMDTPLLHFNTGVAHYRAGQYDRAREELLKARISSRLALVATYNLGLTEYAAGNDAEALRWFRRSRDQEENPRIRQLSIEAIARIRQDAGSEREVETRVRAEPVTREFTEFELYARAGLGSDDNVYRTPSEPYVDLGNPNRPVVDPVVQSGMFVPLRLGAKYLVNSFEHEAFFASYRLSGRYYPDQELENANEYVHELAIGTEYDRREENRQSKIFSAFSVGQHQETYYDPDDGTGRASNGQSIEDRLSYVRYGPEIWTRQSWDRFSFNLWGKAQLWNYENVDVVPEYDHEYFDVGGHVQYRFAGSSLLRLVTEYYQRNYSDRPAFELDGTQPIGNPAVEYTYIDYGVVARQRITNSLWAGVDYTRTERSDGYLGYNDYSRNGYGAEFGWSPGDRFRIRGDVVYRVYDYTNAFAFNNPVAGRKTMETLTAGLTAMVELAWNLRLVAEYDYSEVASNDARIAYDRSMYMLSLQWNYD